MSSSDQAKSNVVALIEERQRRFKAAGKPRQRPQPLTQKTIVRAIADALAGGRYVLADGLAPGMQLRVQPLGARWSVRTYLLGEQKRFDIGGVCAGKEDVGGKICLDTARFRCSHLKEKCRHDQDPTGILEEWRTGVPTYKQEEARAKRPPPSWPFETAVDKFLDDKLKTRSPATYDSYAKILGGLVRGHNPNRKRHRLEPEITRFAGRDVASITREEIAECVAAVCCRAHSAGVHVKTAMQSMWTFLGDDSRRRMTSVAPNMLLGLKAPEPPTPVVPPAPVQCKPHILQLFDGDKEDARRDIPSPLAMGRAIAIARCGALGDRQGLSIELLAGSLQRRQAVNGAVAQEITLWDETPGCDLVWSIPPFRRKKSNRRRAHLSHDVVLVAGAAVAARKLVDLSGSQPYLFPARKGLRTKNPHVDSGYLNHILQTLPGVDMSCHAFRRGFASHGEDEDDLQFSLDDIKLVLDHGEGAPAGDVTAGHYALSPLHNRKRAIMQKWMSWLEKQVAAAIEADPDLTDAEKMLQAVYVARYGEVKLAKRAAYRTRRNRPMWTKRVGDKR